MQLRLDLHSKPLNFEFVVLDTISTHIVIDLLCPSSVCLTVLHRVRRPLSVALRPSLGLACISKFWPLRN